MTTVLPLDGKAGRLRFQSHVRWDGNPECQRRSMRCGTPSRPNALACVIAVLPRFAPVRPTPPGAATPRAAPHGALGLRHLPARMA